METKGCEYGNHYYYRHQPGFTKRKSLKYNEEKIRFIQWHFVLCIFLNLNNAPGALLGVSSFGLDTYTPSLYNKLLRRVSEKNDW
jgi:hypothetical protein